jgi:hypothetical protein
VSARLRDFALHSKKAKSRGDSIDVLRHTEIYLDVRKEKEKIQQEPMKLYGNKTHEVVFDSTEEASNTKTNTM